MKRYGITCKICRRLIAADPDWRKWPHCVTCGHTLRLHKIDSVTTDCLGPGKSERTQCACVEYRCTHMRSAQR